MAQADACVVCMDGAGRIFHHTSSQISTRRSLRSATSPSQCAKIDGETVEDEAASDTTTCVICFEETNDQSSVRLPMCGHDFHGKCIVPWLLGGDLTCPKCRAKPPLRDDNCDLFDTSGDESDGDQEAPTSYTDATCVEYAKEMKEFDGPLAKQFETIRTHEHDLVSIRHDHATVKRELREHEVECVREIDEFGDILWNRFETVHKSKIRWEQKLSRKKSRANRNRKKVELRIIHKMRKQLIQQDALIAGSR